MLLAPDMPSKSNRPATSSKGGMGCGTLAAKQRLAEVGMRLAGSNHQAIHFRGDSYLRSLAVATPERPHRVPGTGRLTTLHG